MTLTVKSTVARPGNILWLILLCGAAFADTPAPQFTVRSLDGQTFSNASLRGNIVLLEFWTTWCPVCRNDQPAVDNVQAAFGGNGLVVIAVDDGEPEALVRKYLQSSPRSCAVVATGDRSLAARFGVHSYPHYVLLDRGGRSSSAGPVAAENRICAPCWRVPGWARGRRRCRPPNRLRRRPVARHRS
ncbi:MAG TPA: TlpA disulfide reductase family protein [Terriglobales bacterium]|nr:TlpA disulfide reductase family protein [Terriglobales bacterium]